MSSSFIIILNRLLMKLILEPIVSLARCILEPIVSLARCILSSFVLLNGFVVFIGHKLEIQPVTFKNWFRKEETASLKGKVNNILRPLRSLPITFPFSVGCDERKPVLRGYVL